MKRRMRQWGEVKTGIVDSDRYPSHDAEFFGWKSLREQEMVVTVSRTEKWAILASPADVAVAAWNCSPLVPLCTCLTLFFFSFVKFFDPIQDIHCVIVSCKAAKLKVTRCDGGNFLTKIPGLIRTCFRHQAFGNHCQLWMPVNSNASTATSHQIGKFSSFSQGCLQYFSDPTRILVVTHSATNP
jgi:hypothetical protein